MSNMKSKSVLFVCLGNICRSPMAEAVFRDIVKQRGIASSWTIDSAAIIDYHLGKRPDRRTMTVLTNHGVTDYDHHVRQISPDDFSMFQYIFGMDDANMRDLENIQRHAKGNTSAEVYLLGIYDPKGQRIIEDPYYSDDIKDFEIVYEQCVRCCNAFLDSLES